MEFMDAYNSWSLTHFLGSFLLTLTLGYIQPQIDPLMSGAIVIGAGVGWEVVIDQSLRWNDPRGGDYYDLMWDVAGSALGVAILEATKRNNLSRRTRSPDIGLRFDNEARFPRNPHRQNTDLRIPAETRHPFMIGFNTFPKSTINPTLQNLTYKPNLTYQPHIQTEGIYHEKHSIELVEMPLNP